MLRAHQRFVVLSHVRPDGDALGSQLGLALSLSKLGKTVMVRNEDGVLEKYRFLPGGEFLQTPLSEPQEFDVAIALDTATQSRLGTARNSFAAPRSGSTSITTRPIPATAIWSTSTRPRRRPGRFSSN